MRNTAPWEGDLYGQRRAARAEALELHVSGSGSSGSPHSRARMMLSADGTRLYVKPPCEATPLARRLVRRS